jgi:serine/threonine-protein kinase
MDPANAAREVVPGQVVGGKWRVVRLIGRGGMGAVYEGQNTSIGKKVALKFIDADYAGHAEVVSRFQREAEAASVVESGHIVHVFDSGTTEQGIPYIVMELLQGEDLRSRLNRMGKLPPAEAVHIAIQILRGLARAHASGIVHRDLKPDNIFLVEHDDEPLFVKIVDFGISKFITGRNVTPVGTLTQRGVILGTPFYMSPEQARAVTDLDERTDLWSVGAILYECVSGERPFTGDAYEAIIVSICSTDPADVRSLEPSLSHELGAVIHRALRRDRNARFRNAKEMLLALEATGVEQERPARGRWLAVGAGLMLGAFLTTLALVRLVRAPRATAVLDATPASSATAAPATTAADTRSAENAGSAPVTSTGVADAAAFSPPAVSAAAAPPGRPKKHAATMPVSQPPATSSVEPKAGVAGGLKIKTTYP